MIKLVKEFKTPILFLVKFLTLYLVLNLGYGLFINHYSPLPDPITFIVTKHTNDLLHVIGYSTTVMIDNEHPYVILSESNRKLLSVYEGCNGLNVAIIFIAFLMAYGKLTKKLLWFIPLGLVMIHLINLARISLLFYVTKYLPNYLYFTHKYLFTAIIYAIVFFMWYLWLFKIYKHHVKQT